MLARLPVRLRLAAGFALGITAVLVLAGGFVYVEVGNDLSDGLDASLAARADDTKARVKAAGPAGADLGGVRTEGEETFAQILSVDGRVIESTLPGSTSLLDARELARARGDDVTLDGIAVPGLEGRFRVLAVPVQAPSGPEVAVVGATTTDREEALYGIRRAFALGGPLALLLASAIGYGLGGRALAPVEAMRLRAREITLDQAGERLPTPIADDELRSLAETLNEMLDRVEGALERERTFVSDASHELRTPLAILKSEIELVRRTGGSKADLEDALHSAGEEVEHLVRLAENLLVIARTEQGRMPLRREAVRMEELFERVGARFGSDTGRSLAFEAVDADGYEVDPVRVEQALDNLIDNALRYGEGAVRVRAVGSERELRITVSDDGVGFPEAFRPEAFERFSQASTARGDTGTGLGLAIVRSIARAHGGDARIVDAEQGGAVVAVTFVTASESP